MNSSHQTGVSLIEVLITILVISFGFLSVVSLQMGNLSSLINSNQHYQASLLANSMGDALRANIDFVADYDGVDTQSFSKSCSISACEMFERDVEVWKLQIEDESQSLFDPKGEISLSGSSAIVEVSWLEKRAKKDATRLTYQLQVPLL